MAQPSAPQPDDDRLRAKRERILAVSRTVHSIPAEEGGMLKRSPAPAAPQPGGERFWRRATLAAGGLGALAGGLAATLWLRRR